MTVPTIFNVENKSVPVSSLFEAQDEVDRQREELIALIEGKLHQHVELIQLFTIQWTLGIT